MPQARDVDAVRQFNRLYTRQIGVLEEGLLDTPFTLTQARVLYELGQVPASLAKDIGERLGLDAGYLSRILQVFARRKLITRKRSPADSRQVAISLTALGKRIQQDLDRRSHRSIEQMLERLGEEGRDRFVSSVASVHRVLAPERKSAGGEIVLRANGPGDVGWAIGLHGELYAAEFGWNTEFEGLVASLFGEFTRKPARKGEKLWIAKLDGERVGCVFLVRNEHDAQAAQIRCLLVDPRVRGKGVGRRLVEECIAFARAERYVRVVLWTNDILSAARNLYQSMGFSLTGESVHHSFGKKLNGQNWGLDLKPDPSNKR